MSDLTESPKKARGRKKSPPTSIVRLRTNALKLIEAEQERLLTEQGKYITSTDLLSHIVCEALLPQDEIESS
jgi:hypothetical protein